jgi:hypothetical protein
MRRNKGQIISLCLTVRRFIPVILGGGIPLLSEPARQVNLKLTKNRVYNKTGIVSLEYAVK